MHSAVAPQPDPHALPLVQPGLEEAAAAAAGDWPQAAAFAVYRAGALAKSDERRPLLFVATAAWMRERGTLSARGLAQLGLDLDRVILIRADKDLDALWALEEGLKSGAVAGAVGTVAQASFVATRRLDFAARAGQAAAVLLRAGGGNAKGDAVENDDLSVARLRWKVGVQPSVAHPFDRQSPGALRLTAVLTRRRDGPLGQWMLEQDDETHRLRLAAGLAGDGLVAGGRSHAAA
jgi:protein ImuA